MNVNLLLRYLKEVKKYRSLKRLPIEDRISDNKDTVENRVQKKGSTFI